jgi:hypothetical protein
MSRATGITVGVVKYRLQKLGLKRPVKYTYNEAFFSTWSNDMAYIFGFICGDGYLSHRHGYLMAIELAIKDIEILTAAIKDIEILTAMASRIGIVPTSIIERHTGNSAGKKYCKISLYSKEIYNDLIKLGVTETKSLTLHFPNIPDEYLQDFVRGVFDSDGCISVFDGGKDCFVCCSHAFGNSLGFVLNWHGIETIKPRISSITKVRLSTKKENIKRFFDFLYGNCDLENDLYLKRKYNKFLLCV